jgi:hypothetical protein
LARLCTLGNQLTDSTAGLMVNAAASVVEEGLSRRQRAASLALKRYGRQSQTQAASVLRAIEGLQASGEAGKLEIYNDIKFEFEYYA